MATLQCKMCGGTLIPQEEGNIAVCDSCGLQQTVPKADDDKKLLLFDRAENLRRQCEFDKAYGVYESIVAEFPRESEAYWGLVLCKYGIEYVEDPATKKPIPTCHRISTECVLEDVNYEQACENTDSVTRRQYREDARLLDEIRGRSIAVSANEEPYDIFICYKETDRKGNRTDDSLEAEKLYNMLTEKDYRVFFARITLEDKLGVEYEPYIFAALNSAKVMVVLGSDYDYFHAVWVKNEWSRFLKLMEKDHQKHLIPCYMDMDISDLPKEFKRIQALNMNDLGAELTLLRGIEKMIPKKKETFQQTGQPSAAGPSVQSLLQRIQIFLEDGDWKTADEYCEKVLDIDPKNAEAYLGKLMAQLHVRTRQALAEQEITFEHNSYFTRAEQYADKDLARFLEDSLTTVRERIKLARMEETYQQALANVARLDLEGYREAIGLFSQIPDYKDSQNRIRYCKQIRDEMLERIRVQEQQEREREEERKQRELARQEAERRRLEEIGRGQAVFVVKSFTGLLGSADGTTYKYKIFRDGEKVEEVLVEAGKQEQSSALELQSGPYSVSVEVYGYDDKALVKVINQGGPMDFEVRKNQQVKINTKRNLFSSKILSIG